MQETTNNAKMVDHHNPKYKAIKLVIILGALFAGANIGSTTTLH